jgi:creatine kinase
MAPEPISLHGAEDDAAFKAAYDGKDCNVNHEDWINAGCGVNEYMFEAKGCTFDPREKDKLPDLKQHNSYIVDLLRDDPEGQKLWDELKTKETSKGVTLAKCIKTGMDNKGHPNIKTVGLVGGDEECYTGVFKELFEKVTRARHGFGPEKGNHVSNMNVEDLSTVDMDPFCKYVHTARVRTGRSVSGYTLPPSNSFQERRRLEKAITDALATMTGELEGKPENGGGYFPLPGSKSNPQGNYEFGMPEAYGKELLAMGNLFQEPDSILLLSGGMGRHWPDARGIFHNNNKNLFVWLNEEDHMRIVSMQGKKGTCTPEGKDMRAVAKRFMDACNTIEGLGLKFMKSEALGWILTCPSNCGTGLRAGCQVDCEKLFAHITNGGEKVKFEKQTDKDGNERNVPALAKPDAWKGFQKATALQARGTGGVDDTSVTVFDVSNADRMGKTDVELVNICIDGIAFLTVCEHALRKDYDNNKAAVDAAIAIASTKQEPANKQLQDARTQLLEAIPALTADFGGECAAIPAFA